MRGRGLSSSRTTAVLCAAALSLHQLRYLVAYGAGSGRALAQQGHGYLDLVMPGVGIALAVIAAHFLMRLAHPRGEQRPAIGWFSASVSLLAIYCCQESLEGLLASGHPDGLAALTATGGWVALPLAVALGAVVSLLLRGANDALSRPAATALRWVATSRSRALEMCAAPAAPAEPMWSPTLGARGPPGHLHP